MRVGCSKWWFIFRSVSTAVSRTYGVIVVLFHKSYLVLTYMCLYWYCIATTEPGSSNPKPEIPGLVWNGRGDSAPLKLIERTTLRPLSKTQIFPTDISLTKSEMISGAEVAKHNSREDCWVIVNGKAYDVTEFLPEHPGGPAIIVKYAGRDATAAYEPIHPKGILDENLKADKHKGIVDMKTVVKEKEAEVDEAELSRRKREENKPSLEQCFNLMDFEAVAKQVMKAPAWAYYSSGADDEITMRENHSAYQKIWFRPRILIDVEQIDMSTTMLGTKTAAPFYVTATALGKLGHPEGECVLTRSAKTHDIIQMIPTLASCSFDEIADAAKPEQTQWLQLYVNKDREITKKIVLHAEERGCKGLFITVDAPQLGRREKDMRVKFGENAHHQTGDSSVDRSQGAARAISSFIDPSLNWKDIPWFKSITKMPIILKGVQCAEDAIAAAEMGCDGVVLSNHGGRQLEYARPAIEVLVEVVDALEERGLKDKLEIYVDGGIRRGTDILKAICLGAKGVGIGRPFLYAMSAYGQAGVERAMQLLKDEMEMNLRLRMSTTFFLSFLTFLVGAPTIAHLRRDMLDTRALQFHSVATPFDTLSAAVYDPMIVPRAKI